MQFHQCSKIVGEAYFGKQSDANTKYNSGHSFGRKQQQSPFVGAVDIVPLYTLFYISVT